ncbi:hypothetical protein SAMD00019534_021420 [Acytostelium subglobosum LB1]|uniref:hypothetical protein n=1 Tax=Acytostelium subglobosum LB1 TaxID=1410327 RepID=UPI000644B3CE|nr:hypothetical protein SAMD00019534_021420 [Acytostelium subglobosum LB1]GAM18967.1 hypothetical protein SAMD00019534_021420 [Acytostelium subglobosum LB1]|eukprot:XP_012758187.1 hypothetical protein SAMD00019534_021420 [Acytostelium subglobosum LB1]
MEQIPQEFINTIMALSSPDTNTIRVAEEKFNSYKSQPDQLVSCLLFLLVNSTEPVLKEYSSVLIRPLITPTHKDTLWSKISSDLQNNIKIQLLRCLRSETSKSIRHKVVNIVSAIAPELISKNEWSELMGFLIEEAKSPNENMRESAYLIIGQMIGEIESIIKPHIGLFKGLIQQGLCDSSIIVQIAALRTISTFVNMSDVDKTQFQPLIPLMLATITKAIETNHENSAQDGIVVFIVIAESKPSWLAKETHTIMKAFFEIINSDMVEEETKHFVMEFFLAIAERRASIYKMNPAYLTSLVQIMYKWLSTREDISVESWNQLTNETDNSDDTSDADVAQDAFDRLSLAIPKNMLQAVSGFLPSLIKSNFWGDRFAALMSITMFCEGCKHQLKNNLESMLNLILPLVNDPVPRVRWCLFFCLGQMATDFEQDIHAHYQILFQTVSMIVSDPNPRVQAVVCLFLSTFLEEFDKEKLTPHTNSLFGYLSPLMQSSHFSVAENALSAFSSIVECISEDFLPYYDSFMPFLTGILQNHTSKQSRTLRGRALEAISLIGLAVKKEKFANDLHQILTFMSSQPPFESDDPQIDFFLRACTRFCQCMEKDFKQYLGFCMKPILGAINANVEIVSTEYTDDYTEESISDNSAMTVENKSLALSMLVIYSTILNEELFEYIDTLYKEVVPLIDYEYNEDIRTNAVALMPCLLRISKAHFEKKMSAPNGAKVPFTSELFNNILSKLLVSLDTESVSEIIGEKLKVIGECIEVMGEKHLTDGQMRSIFQSIIKTLDSLDEMRIELEGDVDEEDDDPQINAEMQFLEDAYNFVAIAVGDIIITSKDSSVVHLQEILLANILARITGDEDSDQVKSSMLCIMDDLIEYGAPNVGPLYAHIINPLLKSCHNSDVSVKHAASYGLGMAASKAPQHFAPFVIGAIEALNMLVSMTNARHEDNLEVTEGAVSSIGKIIRYCGAQLGDMLGKIIPLWCSHLPVQDESERKAVLDNMLELIKLNGSFFGQKEFVVALRVIIDAVQKEYLPDDKKDTVKQLLVGLQPLGILNQVSQADIEVLQKALQ